MSSAEQRTSRFERRARLALIDSIDIDILLYISSNIVCPHSLRHHYDSNGRFHAHTVWHREHGTSYCCSLCEDHIFRQLVRLSTTSIQLLNVDSLWAKIIVFLPRYHVFRSPNQQ